MSVTGPTSLSGGGSSVTEEPIIPDTELEPSSTPDEGVQDGDTTPTPDGTEPEVIGKPGDDKGDIREDGRVIPKWMRALKDTDPEAFKRAKTDLFDLQGRRSIHPTVQAAREEHDLIQSVGGKEGIESLRGDATFFKEAANQFLKGDPAFVKDLWDEDPIAAALHVQPMLEAFKTKDFEGYRTTIARMQDTELQAVGFGPALKNLIDAVEKGDKETALNILVKGVDARGNPSNFVSWYNSIGDIAKKAEDPRVKSLLAERAKARETQTQTEHNEFLKSYRGEAINTVVGEAEKVFDSFFKGRKLDPEDRLDLLRDAVKLANSKVEADKAFMEQREKHLELGDRHSALQLTKARFSRELPDAVKRIARRYGMASGTPANGTQRQQQQPAGGGAQPAGGFVAVSARPDGMDIDRGRTTNEMILSKRAILKDGKKVDWSKVK
jgi:hypothetical protein